jgi:hypothetical protein
MAANEGSDVESGYAHPSVRAVQRAPAVAPAVIERSRARGTPGEATLRTAAPSAGVAAGGSETTATVTVVGGLPVDADPELVELFRRARWIGGQGREPLVSFTSLFLALLGGGTPIADWVKATAAELQLLPEAVLDGWRRMGDARAFPPGLTIAQVRAPQAPEVGGDDITPSIRSVLKAAVSYQHQLGASALGARHVLAAYLLASPGHQVDFDSWELRPRSWAARFIVWLAVAAPDEADAWRAVCIQAMQPEQSRRLGELLGTAAVIAEQRSAPAVEVSDLVHALLYCARLWPTEAVSNVWLLQELGGAAISALAVPDRLARGPEILLRGNPAFRPDRAVNDWLDHAQFWSLSYAQDELGLRHVVAALLSPRGPADGKRMLRRAGARPDKLARGFARLVERVTRDDHATWRWLLDHDRPPRELRKPGYTSDVARGDDTLSIDGDVRALAAVLASVDTSPPLSVGLFGNWGSGKSFFMAMLRDHIRALAQQSAGANQTAYCSEIAQIEFNAWHYIDVELWASLVSHVLDSLEGYFRGDEKSLAEQRKTELVTAQLKRAELDKQQQQLDARRAELETKVSSYQVSRVELAKVVIEHAVSAGRDQAAEAHVEVRKALDDMARKIGVAPGELTLRAAREQTNALHAWWKRRSWKELMIGLALVAVAVVAARLAAAYADATTAALAKLATAIAPALIVAERILRVGRPIAKLAQDASALGSRVTRQIAETDPAMFLEQQAIDAAQHALARERQQLDQRSDELRALLDSARKPGMRDYVLKRAMHYRDKLGIVASVHRDFQNLSEQLRDDRTEPKLQRIILYIDDLDRCPPERVVEMLQAIHLLLSFELFVVVVAVDPKWLLRSLEAYYARQFQNWSPALPGDRESRPQFYLEKIFQIPYALQPMTASRFGDMVGSLLRAAVVPDASERSTAGDTGRTGGGTTALAAERTGTPDTASGARTALLPAAGASALVAVPSVVRRLDLTPRNLEITSRELAHLRTLGPLVASPRAAKRLTNLYRIVRAGLDGDGLDEFIDGQFQLTQIVLAAVVGCPDIAVTWFQDIFARTTGDTAALLAPLLALSSADPRAKFLHERVSGCPEIASWDHSIEVCTRAARYSFETGALLALVPTRSG